MPIEVDCMVKGDGRHEGGPVCIGADAMSEEKKQIVCRLKLSPPPLFR